MKLSLDKATVNTRRDDDVLTFDFKGSVDRNTLRTAAAMWGMAGDGAHTSAYVARLEEAEWDDDFYSDYAPLLSSRSPSPVAVVVREKSVPWFRRYALAQAFNGSLCGIFTDPSLALEWVTQRAAAMLA